MAKGMEKTCTKCGAEFFGNSPNSLCIKCGIEEENLLDRAVRLAGCSAAMLVGGDIEKKIIQVCPYDPVTDTMIPGLVIALGEDEYLKAKVDLYAFDDDGGIKLLKTGA